MSARGENSASYLFRTTHLFKTAAIKSAPSEEMQSEMFRLLWQHVCLHLWRHKQSLSYVSQETRRTLFCKPHKASMLCEDHNYWHPCVKILCLWKAVPSVSGIMLLGKGGNKPTVWTDCQTGPWKTTGKLSKMCWTVKADFGIVVPSLSEVHLEGKNILLFVCSLGTRY